MSAVSALPARQRTELLHRMLVVRHLSEKNPGAKTNRVDFALGEEAIAVGVSTALRPSDMLIRAEDELLGDAALDSVVVRVVTISIPDAVAHREAARRIQQRTLFVIRATSTEPEQQESVAGFDVEAVLSAATTSLRAARAGKGPLVLWLRTDRDGVRPDPINVLVVRMMMDRQLDANASDAIDAHARVQVIGMEPSTPNRPSASVVVGTLVPA